MSERGWSTTKIALALWPLAVGAMSVNVFFASLVGSWMGLPVIPPRWAVALGAVIAIPAARISARHFRRLMDEADQDMERLK